MFPYKAAYLLVCAIAIRMITTSAFSPVPILQTRTDSSRLATRSLRFSAPSSSQRKESKDDNIEAEKLQAELNKLTEELPMFASFDASNIDESAIPVPTFTAIIIAIGSIVWTYYLFDIGINGFPTQ